MYCVSIPSCVLRLFLHVLCVFFCMCCVFPINCGLVNTLNYLIRKNVGPYKPYKPYIPYRSCKPYPLAEAYLCRNPEQGDRILKVQSTLQK